MVYLTYFSPRLLEKVKSGVFSISRFLVKILINKNYRNSKTSSYIDMKHGPLSKLENKIQWLSKTCRWHLVHKLCCHCPFSDLQLIWSYQDTGFQMHGVWSITLSLLLTIIYLTKVENRTRKTTLKLLHQQKPLYSPETLKILTFSQKDANISKTDSVVLLLNIFWEAKYVFLLTYEVSIF